MKICLFCKTEFKPLPHSRHDMKFCDPNCRYKFWCKNNKERSKLISLTSKLKRKDKNVIYNREYYLKNKQKIYHYTKTWRENNRERSVQQVVVRMSRVRGAEGSYTLQEWQEVKEKFNFCCALCGKNESEVKLTRDHIIPITKGGSNYISNIQPLCGPCNSHKSNHL